MSRVDFEENGVDEGVLNELKMVGGCSFASFFPRHHDVSLCVFLFFFLSLSLSSHLFLTLVLVVLLFSGVPSVSFFIVFFFSITLPSLLSRGASIIEIKGPPLSISQRNKRDGSYFDISRSTRRLFCVVVLASSRHLFSPSLARRHEKEGIWVGGGWALVAYLHPYLTPLPPAAGRATPSLSHKSCPAHCSLVGACARALPFPPFGLASSGLMPPSQVALSDLG